MPLFKSIIRLIRRSDPTTTLVALDTTNTGERRAVLAARAAWLLYALAPLITYITPVYLALLAQQVPLTEREIGLLAGAESLGGVIAALTARWWITRVNWRAAALAGLLVMIAGIVATAFTRSPDLLLVIRATASIFGGGPLIVIAIVVLSESAAPDRNFAYAFAAQLVIGLVVLLLLPVAGDALGWTGVIILLAGCFVTALPLVGLLPKRAANPAAFLVPAASLTRPSWLLLLSIALLSASTQASWAFSEVLGSDVGMSLSGMSQLLVGSTVLAVVGSLAAAPIGQRIGRLRAFIGGTAIILLCVFPLYLVLGPTSYISYYLIGACASAFIAPFQLGALAGQKDASAAASLMPAVQAAGMMAGPAAVGLTADTSHGPLWSVSIAVAFLLLAAPAFAAAIWSRKLNGVPPPQSGTPET